MTWKSCFNAKFQGFITQFMETESFIHLKRTLLSDFMIGQQGGDQTLDNILSCIMGNCILFAFVNQFLTLLKLRHGMGHVIKTARLNNTSRK